MCWYIHFCTLTLYLKTTYSTLLTVKRRSMKFFFSEVRLSRHPNIKTEYFHHKYYQKTYFTPVPKYFSKIVYLRNICLSKN